MDSRFHGNDGIGNSCFYPLYFLYLYARPAQPPAKYLTAFAMRSGT